MAGIGIPKVHAVARNSCVHHTLRYPFSAYPFFHYPASAVITASVSPSAIIGSRIVCIIGGDRYIVLVVPVHVPTVCSAIQGLTQIAILILLIGPDIRSLHNRVFVLIQDRLTVHIQAPLKAQVKLHAVRRQLNSFQTFLCVVIVQF